RAGAGPQRRRRRPPEPGRSDSGRSWDGHRSPDTADARHPAAGLPPRPRGTLLPVPPRTAQPTLTRGPPGRQRGKCYCFVVQSYLLHDTWLLIWRETMPQRSTITRAPQPIRWPLTLPALLAPATLFALGLFAVRDHPRFAWL